MKKGSICAIAGARARTFRGAGLKGFGLWIAARWDVAPEKPKSRAPLDFVRRRGPWETALRHAGLAAQHTTQTIQAHFDLNLHLQFARFVYGRAAGSSITRIVKKLSSGETGSVAGWPGTTRHHELPVVFQSKRGSAWFESLGKIRSQLREMTGVGVFRTAGLVRQTREIALALFRGADSLAGHPARRQPNNDRQGAAARSLAIALPLVGAFKTASVRELLARTFTLERWAPSTHTAHSRVEQSARFRLAYPAMRAMSTPGFVTLSGGRATAPSIRGGPVVRLQPANYPPSRSGSRPYQPTALQTRQTAPISLTFVRHEANPTAAITQTLAQIQQTLSSNGNSREAAPATVDIPYLTRQVYDQFERELRIEKERRGL